jgi:hypothetical protein
MESDCLLVFVGAAESATDLVFVLLSFDGVRGSISVDPATGFDGVRGSISVDPATGFDDVLAGSRGLVSRPDLVEIFASALE